MSGSTNFDAYLAGNPLHTQVALNNEWFTALGTTRPSQNPQALTNAVNTAAKGQENQLRTAGQQVTDYTKKTCNIDLGGSSGSTTTTTKR